MKENFAALLRFRPESRPPASVEPLRETPAARHALHTAHDDGVLEVRLVGVLLAVCAQRFRQQEEEARQQEARTEEPACLAGGDEIIKHDLEQQRRQGSDEEQKQCLGLEGVLQNRPPVLPEHDENRNQRANMQENVQHMVGTCFINREAHQDSAEQQMTTGGNRKKLAKPLHEAENGGLQNIHRGSTPFG